MALKFEVSPPKRPSRAESEVEDYEVLYLAPFKPFPKLLFHNVKVQVEKRKRLIIRNPSSRSITVNLTHLPPEDHGLEFSFTQVELAAQEETTLEVAWTPTEAGSWSETIPVITSSKFKSEIKIVCSSVNPQAKKVVRKPLSTKVQPKPTALAKKLVLTKPLRNQPAKPSAISSKVQQQVRFSRALPRATTSPCRRQTFLVSAENKENSLGSPPLKLPESSKHELSRRFEDFVLSPLNPNVNVNQGRSSALEDLVMSPLVLASNVARPDCDVVDGDASKPGRGMHPIHEEIENSPPADLRRATFDVGNCHPYVMNKFTFPSEVHLPTVEDTNDELYDSLEEVSPLKQDPSRTTVLVNKGNSDLFMNSTIKFDLLSPSSDPRRCSTGVKDLSIPHSQGNKNVRKDLFDEMCSPDHQKINVDGCFSLAHPFDVSQPTGSPNGEIPECANDRLSTETYVKDRLSTSTYIKDRLSTETYIKDHHSRGSCSVNSDSCDELSHAGNSSLGSARSPKEDDHLRHLRSPLVSIEEEPAVKLKSTASIISVPSIDNKTNDKAETCMSSRMKSTVFMIPHVVDKVVKVAAPQPQSNFSRPVAPTRQKKPSPPKLRKVAMSPTWKKNMLLDLRNRPKPNINSRTQSTSSAEGAMPSKTIPKGGRRFSVGSFSGKTPLSARLPASRLSLSAKGEPLVRIPRGSKRIAQIQAQKSEKLFDMDEILAEVTNVDPFAFSTVSDPFLDRAIFNDNAWIARQQSDMIKWLNALLTPPAELETNTNIPEINVGDLWQRTCRLKDVSLAPSREEVSSDHYNKHARLASLRKAALSLIRSQEVAAVLQKISVRVDQKVLSVREDRDLHLDVGLQQSVLELLLCYNPLWLRIGLEAVYGRTVPLKSNGDYVGLTAFLVHNLLSDEYIVATYSHPTVPHLKLPGYEQELKRFTLKKFLFVVFFLDQAKTRKLISHDPCLFLRTAKYKESRELVAIFARDLLAGIGDVNRFLASLGCRLVAKQTFLDEFEYAVKDLLDLRDGIRLVRVMELILKDDSLHARLRAPPISRLQKVHNVEVALDALKAAGFELSGGITPKDIVDGHKEKTLSLLWQLVYKFQAPRFTAAAEAIQRWWRALALPRELARRARARKRARREAATVVIQAAWRAVAARRRADALREERALRAERRQRAAVVLQAHWRRHAAEEALRRARRAATTIGRWYRGAVETRRLRADFLRRREAAVKLQALVRGVLTRQRFAELRRTAAALRIQTWFRRQRAARRMEAAVPLARTWQTERAACRVLQARLRAQLAARRQRARFVALRQAVLAVQQRWRANRAARRQREDFVELRAAAVAVQRRWRARRAMRTARAEFLARRAAATVLQRRFRARRQRRQLVRLRAAAVAVQRRWRGRRLAKELRVDFLFERRAARTLQTAVRAWLTGRRDRARFLELRGAAVAVQRRWRWRARLRALRLARQEAHLKAATLAVQRRWRALRAGRAARRQFVQLRAAACVLQRRYRALLSMKTARDHFRRLREAAVAVQRRYRAQRDMRRARSMYLATLQSTITIQKYWRAQVVMRAQHSAYISLRSATCLVQVKFRALLAMKIERRKYLRLYSATLTIQRYFRAYRKKKRDRLRYIKLCHAVIFIQHRWRAQRAMITERAHFVALQAAACTLQRRYRAILAMRHDQSNYKQLCSAAVTIQQQFRAQRLMKLNKLRYLALRKAAVVIQQKWRAKQAMAKQRNTYLKLCETVVWLQRLWRSKRAAAKQHTNYQRMRVAALTIQAWWRACVLARKEQRKFQRVLSAVKTIQMYWRLWKAGMQQRRHYHKLQTAAVVIQKNVRGFLARRHYLTLMKTHKNRQILLDSSARLIQLTWRRWLQKKEDIKQRSLAATRIQASWRGYKSRKLHKAEVSRMREISKDLYTDASEPLPMRDRIHQLLIDWDKETVGDLVFILNSLNTICMLSPTLCEVMVHNDIVSKLFKLLCNVNRGVADSEVANMCSKILLILCKYEMTIEDVWAGGTYLQVYPYLMKKWTQVDQCILLYFITILWHFSQSPQKAEIILADEKLKSTILFFLSKFKNRKPKSSNCTGVLPTLVPNWASLKKETRPFSFEDPLYGLRALCYKLKLSTNV